MKVKEILKENSRKSPRLDSLIIKALDRYNMSRDLLGDVRDEVLDRLDNDEYAPSISRLTVQDVVSYMDDAGFEPGTDE